VSVLQAEGNFLGLGACLQDYDLRICTNYKDILDSAKEPPRGTLKNWFAPYVLVIMGMVYNTKEASKRGLLPGPAQSEILRGGSAFLPMARSAIPGCRC